MKIINIISPDLYDEEVELKVQKLTKYAFITQADIARVCGCNSTTVKNELEKHGIVKCPFGYPTTKVIDALELGPYLNNLIKIRNTKKATHISK